MAKTIKKQSESELVMPRQFKDKILQDALAKCDVIADKLASEDLMRFAVNTILLSISKVVGGFSVDEMSKENKVHLISTITADIEDLIMPVTARLLDKDPSNARFDATRLARETKTIEDNEVIIIRHKQTDSGQEISTSIAIEMPKEVSDFIDSIDENTIVGKC